MKYPVKHNFSEHIDFSDNETSLRTDELYSFSFGVIIMGVIYFNFHNYHLVLYSEHFIAIQLLDILQLCEKHYQFKDQSRTVVADKKQL